MKILKITLIIALIIINYVQAIEYVKTEYGFVRGIQSNISKDITIYKGLPYANTTAGNNRWKEPLDADPWEGVLFADKFGPLCPQLGITENVSEDCLSLNIWVPSNSNYDELFPVYIWIHDASLEGNNVHSIDGTSIAKKGIVVVTMNYRSGAFGFLSTPELSLASPFGTSGNYGLLDQIKALYFISKNIQNFGGDPARITIGGGSGSIAILRDSPLTKGFVNGFIFQDGFKDTRDRLISGLNYMSYHTTLDEAEKLGQNYTSQFNETSIEQLRQLPMKLFFDSFSLRQDSYYNSPPLFRPVKDKYLMKYSYTEALEHQEQEPTNQVNMLAGVNANKDCNMDNNRNVTLNNYKAMVENNFDGLADKCFQLYPASNDNEAINATNQLITDTSRFSVWSYSIKYMNATASSNTSMYVYYLDYPFTKTCHDSEMKYVFDTLCESDYNNSQHFDYYNHDRQECLFVNKISSYWVNFIATGNPNIAGSQTLIPALPYWAASQSVNETIMNLGVDKFEQVPLVANERKILLLNEYFAMMPEW